MGKLSGGLGILIAAVPLAISAAEPSGGPYVTQAMVEAQGGFRFSLPRYGTFTIESIDHGTSPGECHVSLESVANDLETSIATGEFELAVGNKKTIKLKAFVLENGVVKCYGPGKGCKVLVDVTSVDTSSLDPL
ncbi:MAG TPA: hypothetical protein VKB34_17230 [Povalibacter sp.]|nr:hypothetical protein [Povalibacter sp.]